MLSSRVSFAPGRLRPETRIQGSLLERHRARRRFEELASRFYRGSRRDDHDMGLYELGHLIVQAKHLIFRTSEQLGCALYASRSIEQRI